MGPELFGVGAAEAVLVFVIALVLVGPQRFPDLAKQGGRWYRIARRYTAEVTKDVRAAINEIEDEVKAETGDLTVVREIGEEMQTQLKETSADIDTIGKEMESDLKATGSELDAIDAESEQASANIPSAPATPPTTEAASTVLRTPSPPTTASPRTALSYDAAAAGEPETVEEEAPTSSGATES